MRSFVRGSAVVLMLLAAANAEPAANEDKSVLFGDIPMVQAASLHSQTLDRAPANVTIITAEEIRRFGYRTLGEALQNVRGLFLTRDRIYGYVGVRGYALAGDFNTRFLVMINGHVMTENIFGSSNLFLDDFGLEMDTISQIEIIRGSSSALYGSNGVFATVNVVTKSPVEMHRASVGFEGGSFGRGRVRASTAATLPGGVNLLVTGSVFRTTGQSLYFPEYDEPENHFGRVVGADGDRGYRSFANLIWRDWSFTGYFNGHRKSVPLNWGEGDFGNAGNWNGDSRNFVEGAMIRELSSKSQLRWRTYYDGYRWRGRAMFRLDGGALEDNRDQSLGDWVGSNLTWTYSIAGNSNISVGGEFRGDLRSRQRNYDVQPEAADLLDVNVRDRAAAVFTQHEWQISRWFTVNAGLRFDNSRYTDSSLSPKIALLFSPDRVTSIKAMYGRAFRNPTAAELFYDDGAMTTIGNPFLRPEHADTLEFALERTLAPGWNTVVSGYRYWLSDVITGVRTEEGLLQYRNEEQHEAWGVEAELNGRLARTVQFGSYAAWQRARILATGDSPANSPRFLGGAHLSFQAAAGTTVALRGRYTGSRTSLNGTPIPAAPLLDLTVTPARRGGTLLQFGVRNLLNRTWYDPVWLAERVGRMRQDGLTFFVDVSWQTAE